LGNRATRVILKEGRDASIRRGHPWIFSGGVQNSNGAQASDFVHIFSSSGDFLGSGHFGEESIAVKVLSRNEKQQSEEEILYQNLSSATELRRSLGFFNSEGTDAFRLVHGEGDSLGGLICDLYNNVAVIDAQTSGMKRVSSVVAELLKKLLPDRIQDIVIRDEDLKDPEISHLTNVEIKENGNRFLVDTISGQKTGFFLDQRENRALVERYSSGKKVLNAFSYTGGFSVYAARGGALSVTSIDTSEKALERLAQHMELNVPNVTSNVIKGDCLPYLKTIPEEFDLIILDPPAFIKHRGALKGGITGYRSINSNAIRQIAPKGLLFTFSCSQLLSRDEFRNVIASASIEARRNVRIIHELHQAPCHPAHITCPESEYLKGFALEVD